MDTKALTIYCNDHLALITGELELARRVQSENEAQPLAVYLADYIAVVTRHRDILKSILQGEDAGEDRLKQGAAWLAEKVGRLKLNDALLSYTDLARVLELESLRLAAEARRSLWAVCETIWPEPPATAADFRELRHDCEKQLRELEKHRIAAAESAFVVAAPR